MSLTILQEPDKIYPVPKSDSLFWEIQSSDFVIMAGTKAQFSVEFGDLAELAGLPCIVKGVTVATSVVLPYTIDTFKSEATGVLTAENFGAMLALNPGFVDCVIIIQGAKVTVTSTKEGVLTPWTFNFTSFSLSPTVVQANGVDESYNKDFIFWDLYQGSTRIAGRNKNDFRPGSGSNGICKINFDQSYLFGRYEPKSNGTWWPEDDFYIDCQFRAFLIRQNIACQQVPQEGYTEDYVLVNSLFQIEEEETFEDHAGALPRKWITGNPIERRLPMNFFEIVGIWLENNGDFREVDPFLIEVKVTMADDSEEFIASSPDPAHKFWFVPTGTMNGPYSGLLEFLPKKVEIQVFGYPEVGARVAYSEKLTRTFSFVNDNCKKQVIYLGDRGSFDTFLLGEVVRENQVVEASVRRHAVALSFEDQLREIVSSDYVQGVQWGKTYRSGPVNEWNEEFLKELERSPQVYRIAETSDGYLLEQVRLIRGTFQNKDADGLPVLDFEFLTAIDVKFHK